MMYFLTYIGMCTFTNSLIISLCMHVIELRRLVVTSAGNVE